MRSSSVDLDVDALIDEQLKPAERAREEGEGGRAQCVAPLLTLVLTPLLAPLLTVLLTPQRVAFCCVLLRACCGLAATDT